MPSTSDTQRVSIGGRELTLSHLTKVLYPVSGTTKADVIAHYARVAPAMIPLIVQRPATRKRWVNGTAEPPFFAKDLEAGAPDWVARAAIEHRERRIDYPLINDVATLAYLAQLATLEVHVPQWRFADDGTRLGPDRLVLDLDPGEGVGLAECATVAGWLRDVLAGMDLDCFPVTSGSKGIHLYARLDGRATSDDVTEMARELARIMASDHPGEVVANVRKELRRGKVFLDWSQNRAAKTTIAPYSLRGLDQPWAAAPRTWRELADPDLRQLTGAEVAERLERDGDLLAGLRPDAGHRLGAYRAKRHAERTPEPGASLPPLPAPAQPRYVLHHHLARREHWDLRLEHDGTLTCWALPKGMPGLGESNRLAVHTEDHPVDYVDFEGAIPPGNYGAGHLAIAEAGTFETHKWRDGEVIVTLLPREVAPAEAAGPRGEAAVGAGGEGAIAADRGARHVALVRMGAAGGADADSWLIHRMSAPPSADGRKRRGVRQRDAVRRPESDSGASPAHTAPGGGASVAGTASGGRASVAGMASGGRASVARTAPEGGGKVARTTPDGGVSVARTTPGDARDPGPVHAVDGTARAVTTGGERRTNSAPAHAAQVPAPMLAEVATADVRLGAGWSFEMKWDGIRCLATLQAGRLRLVSRSGRDLTAEYPDLAASSSLAAQLSDGDVIDGEIVAFGAGGRPDFAALQRRFGASAERATELARLVPVDFVAFDLIHRAGESLMDEPYQERRGELARRLADGERVHLPPAFDGDLAAALATSRQLGLEGVMAKRLASRYRPGVRSGDWLKIKHRVGRDVFVVGWRPSQAEQGAAASLLLAESQGSGGSLRYVGRVGSGLPESERTGLPHRLAGSVVPEPVCEAVPTDVAREAVWIAPPLPAEVLIAGRTGTGRLRQPVWRGWRPDLPAYR